MVKNVISNDIVYVGVDDHKIDLFEGQFEVKNGMSYNSYLILDDKIAVVDSVDVNYSEEWINNIRLELKGRKVAYLIISHMEPDHSGSIMELAKAFPTMLLVGNEKTFKMFDNYFPDNRLNLRLVVKDNDTLILGRKTIRFIFAPMVHWPEVMFSYIEEDKTLFSADAFGKFGALDADDDYDSEFRRYYFGIVGKFGKSVNMVLDKLSSFDIGRILPLHGPMILTGLDYYIDMYRKFANYEYFNNGVLIACSSVYGNTYKVCQKIEELLKNKDLKTCLIDLNRVSLSEAISQAFYFRNIVFASVTYNGSIFPSMKNFLDALEDRNFQNRKAYLLENGTWKASANSIMKDRLSKMDNVEVVSEFSMESANCNEALLAKQLNSLTSHLD